MHLREASRFGEALLISLIFHGRDYVNLYLVIRKPSTCTFVKQALC